MFLTKPFSKRSNQPKRNKNSTSRMFDANREIKKTTTGTEQLFYTCVVILGTFLCRPLQNNNVK